MAVDHERVLARLKAYVLEKPHHGQRDLLAEVARLEAESVRDEGPYRRFVAQFADELEEAFLNVRHQPPGHDTSGDAASSIEAVAAGEPSITPRGDEGAAWPPEPLSPPAMTSSSPRTPALAP